MWPAEFDPATIAMMYGFPPEFVIPYFPVKDPERYCANCEVFAKERRCFLCGRYMSQSTLAIRDRFKSSMQKGVLASQITSGVDGEHPIDKAKPHIIDDETGMVLLEPGYP